MITKIITLSFFIFILCCNNIELVLEDNNSAQQLKNNIFVVMSGEKNERYNREIYSFFGSNKNSDYILTTLFNERKENRVVKKNQVAEKIDYELSITYKLFYKNKECNILNKSIKTKFTFAPKSFGYNFGADRSFERLYTSSIRNNIQKFINSVPTNTECLK